MSLTIPCQKQSPLPSLPLFLSPNFILHSAYHLTLHFCICQLSLHTAGFGPWRQGFGVFYSLSYPQQIDQKLALDPYFKKKKKKTCWINKWKNFRDLKTSCSLMPGHTAAGWSWRMFLWNCPTSAKTAHDNLSSMISIGNTPENILLPWYPTREGLHLEYYMQL